jgi:predicted RNase H-like nuclease (RuvC/YqgF family)
MVGSTSLIGTVPAWLLLMLGFFVAWRISKGGGGTAVTELSKANDILSHRVQELGSEVRDLKIERERLQARTDFQGSLTRAIEPLSNAMDSHEKGANERSTALLSMLDERLPKSDE